MLRARLDERPRREPSPVLLEEWLRSYYFQSTADLGSSGVEVFSLAELRELTGLTQSDLDRVTLDDAPTLGTDALRQAIADRWGSGNRGEVMVTHGSSEAIYLVMHALLQPGDEMIVVDQCYPQLALVAESLGARVRRWSLRFEREFVADLDELRDLLTADTRLVVVNFPHNPTGATLTLQQQAALVDAVEQAGAYLLWDGAFAELAYDAPPLPDPRKRYDRTVSIGTLSKAYGVPGLRVGWCLASEDVLSRLVRLRDHITLNMSPLIEEIATRLVRAADRVLDNRLRQARANRALLGGWVAALSQRVEWIEPQGGVCAFPRLPLAGDLDALCHLIAQRHQVLLIPGSCFGSPRHVRLGFGRATADLQRGLDCLGTYLCA